MLSVEMRARSKSDEELRAVRVLPLVRHDQESLLVHLSPQILVLESWSIDRFSSFSISQSEISSLYHESSNDSMHGTSFEVQSFRPRFIDTFFASRECSETAIQDISDNEEEKSEELRTFRLFSGLYLRIARI